MQLYEWLSTVASNQSSGKALVYRDTYLSWRGLLHWVDRRAQELHALGVTAGAWVGLMLGNVPDFVILALALSKIEAVVVPLDPTTGNRELEMVLEAAPLRALVTRPRGGEGNATRRPALLRRAADPAPGLRGPPSKFVPESRRRLQGTLLSCGLYKRTPPVNLTDGDPPEVVQFTATVGGDPKGVVKTGANLASAAEAIRKTLEVTASDRVLCTLPLHASYGFDFGLLTSLATARRCSWRTRSRRSASPSCCASRTSTCSRARLRCSVAGARADGQAAEGGRRPVPELGLGIAGAHRGILPRAVRDPAALVLPHDAGGPAGRRPRRQGAGERRTRLRGCRVARRQPQGRTAGGRRRWPHLGPLGRAVDRVRPEDPPAQARRRRADRRPRRRLDANG